MIDAIAFMLFLDTWLQGDESISDLDDKFIREVYKSWVTGWLPSRTADHCGDCTKVARTCIRCSVDQLFEEATRIHNAATASS